MKILLYMLVLLILSPLHALNTTVEKSPFTEQEKAWMAQHPTINFTGDPDWLPFEGFTKDGRYIGIVSEILRIIEKQTSLKFNIIPTKSWTESVSMLEKGKVDMLTVSDAWSDPKYLYTNPVLPNPIVIVAEEGHPYVDSVYYLQYESIAIIKGYKYADLIRKKYPDYIFYEVKNVQEGLDGVATGKYDVLLASMALATYSIEKMQLSNVKVVGKTEYQIKVQFAVRKEYAPLVNIINKVYIDEQKSHELLKEWTYQKYVEKTNYSLIGNLILLLLVILMGAAILYLLYKKKTQAHLGAESVVSDKQEEINSAIKYASLLDEGYNENIQGMKEFFDDSFTAFHPKNIKSAIFTYFDQIDRDRALLLFIDARGEGIESILNSIFLKRFINSVERQIKNGAIQADPANILELLGSEIHQAMDKTEEKMKPDNIGFDAAAILIDKAGNSLVYAGANIPLIYTRNHEVNTIRADKHSVGTDNYKFKSHTVDIIDTMDFYLISRGFIDQTGGPQSLPLGKRKVKEIIGKYENYNMDTQKKALIKAFMEHMGSEPRVGDVAIIGFRVTGE